MASENKIRTYSGVYDSLKKISDEEGIDFGLGGYTAEDFKRKYFTGPGNITNLYNKLSQISDEEGVDFGLGTRDEWLASFGYKQAGSGYQTLSGKRVGGKPQPQQAKPQSASVAQTPWSAQHPQPTDYLHRPEMDQQDILSGQALRTASDKRQQAVSGAANQGMEQVHQAEAQRQQPIVKTNTPADQYVIKSEGQWEDDVRQSAAKSAQNLFGVGIDYEVGRVIDESTKRWEQAFDPRGMIGEGAEIAALSRANREIDPERLTRDLTNELQNRISSWLQQPGKTEAIMDEAAKLGVSPESYGEMVVNEITSQARQKLDQKVLDGYMPKGTADYIFNGLHDSLLGTMMDMATMTRGQRQMMQRANHEYSQKNRKENG